MNILKKFEGVPLSNVDIENATGKKIVLFSQLGLTTVDTLLGKEGFCVILVNDTLPVGHWVALLRKGKVVEWFDPYGEFDVESPEGQKVMKMVYNSGCSLKYNDQLLQRQSSNIATCGRWSIARVWYKYFDVDTFCKMMFDEAKAHGITTDDLVTMMTLGQRL